jgi:hypothetical protein
LGPTADGDIDHVAVSPADQVIEPFGPVVYSYPNFMQERERADENQQSSVVNQMEEKWQKDEDLLFGIYRQ